MVQFRSVKLVLYRTVMSLHHLINISFKIVISYVSLKWSNKHSYRVHEEYPFLFEKKYDYFIFFIQNYGSRPHNSYSKIDLEH